MRALTFSAGLTRGGGAAAPDPHPHSGVAKPRSSVLCSPASEAIHGTTAALHPTIVAARAAGLT